MPRLCRGTKSPRLVFTPVFTRRYDARLVPRKMPMLHCAPRLVSERIPASNRLDPCGKYSPALLGCSYETKDLVGVSEEALKVRTEAARLSDAEFEPNAALPSARAEAHAKVISAKASSLEASLGLSLAQGELIRTIGEMPR